MFYVILLEDKTRLCIPASWVFAINVAKAFTHGFNRNEKKIIFFSNNGNETPNFLLPIKSTFDLNQNSCYRGYIKNVFGSKAECVAHYEKNKNRRMLLPPIYSEIREVQAKVSDAESDSMVRAENENRWNIKIEIKKENEPLRRAIQILCASAPVFDLTNEQNTVVMDSESVLILDDDINTNQDAMENCPEAVIFCIN